MIRRTTGALALCALLVAGATTTTPSWSADSGAPEAARGLLSRLLPEAVDRIGFEEIPSDRGRDVFEIESVGERVVIRGNTGVSMATGLGWYLRHHSRAHVSWYGDQLERLVSRGPDGLAPLPEVTPKVRRVSWARHRYFLNYCCFGYSLPWWDWEEWERLIDWMALSGVNMPLAVTGQEAVWRAVGRRLGLDDAEIAAFLAGPPYLPFGWMGCLDGWGGPLPASWIDRHEELQRRILERQRALGMRPVLQGFTGHVPAAVATRFEGAKLHQIEWIEWKTHLLDPLDPLFPRVARLFLEEQTRRFGTDHLYAADTFIEMTPPDGDPRYLDRLGRAIYGGMSRVDPQAVWVLQGWAFMFRRSFWTQERIRAFLDAVPDDRMVVLDLFCESNPVWSWTDAFCGKPWLWCNVQNFGRTVFLGGRLDRNGSGLAAARRDPERGRLSGLGFVNEGLGYNPIVYDHMFEMAWRDEAVDLREWCRGYARHRYGREDADAEAAWDILLETVYSGAHGAPTVLLRVPSLEPAGGPAYDNARLAAAWERLLAAGARLGGLETYRFDLVNVARQVLSNHGSRLRTAVAKAHRARDVGAFRAAASDLLRLIDDLDELLATREEFLLGRCLESAKRWGGNDDERSRFEWNARRVLTLWGTGRSIRDYARKEWSGMLSGFYRKRWERLLGDAGAALEEGRPFDAKAFDEALRRWEGEWSSASESYPTEARGDSLAVARRLWARYGPALGPDAISLTTGKPVVASSSLPAHPARLAVDGHAGDTDRYWATDVGRHPGPAWIRIDLEEPTRVGRVVVVGYYGDERSYGFTVETSLDGDRWDVVADRRESRDLSTEDGYTVRFAPRPVRYLRVTQTRNSANTGRHLVEVMAYEE